ncbi:MAG: hypothetical protein NTX79_03775 [Candidatus Micrarchaeota archaeon]|nr:hypothetical protein [Candidatus Micrarchaeota archaeon]
MFVLQTQAWKTKGIEAAYKEINKAKEQMQAQEGKKANVGFAKLIVELFAKEMKELDANIHWEPTAADKKRDPMGYGMYNQFRKVVFDSFWGLAMEKGPKNKQFWLDRVNEVNTAFQDLQTNIDGKKRESGFLSTVDNDAHMAKQDIVAMSLGYGMRTIAYVNAQFVEKPFSLDTIPVKK